MRHVRRCASRLWSASPAVRVCAEVRAPGYNSSGPCVFSDSFTMRTGGTVTAIHRWHRPIHSVNRDPCRLCLPRCGRCRCRSRLSFARAAIDASSPVKRLIPRAVLPPRTEDQDDPGGLRQVGIMSERRAIRHPIFGAEPYVREELKAAQRPLFALFRALLPDRVRMPFALRREPPRAQISTK